MFDVLKIRCEKKFIRVDQLARYLALEKITEAEYNELVAILEA